MFFSARPNADNSTVFNEAYSYIPQSVVGDNTGFAIFDLETKYPKEERFVVQEGHDSIIQDVPNKPDTIFTYLQRARQAFDRTIEFHNGIKVNIPIEAEIGFDMATTVEFKEFSEQGLKRALEELNEKIEKRKNQAA